MQHIECYTERFRQRCLTKIFFSFTFLFNLLLSNGRSRSFLQANQFFVGNYLPFINGGTILNNRSLLTSISSSITSCRHKSSTIYWILLFMEDKYFNHRHLSWEPEKGIIVFSKKTTKTRTPTS